MGLQWRLEGQASPASHQAQSSLKHLSDFTFLISYLFSFISFHGTGTVAIGNTSYISWRHFPAIEYKQIWWDYGDWESDSSILLCQVVCMNKWWGCRNKCNLYTPSGKLSLSFIHKGHIPEAWFQRDMQFWHLGRDWHQGQHRKLDQKLWLHHASLWPQLPLTRINDMIETHTDVTALTLGFPKTSNCFVLTMLDTRYELADCMCHGNVSEKLKN